MSEGRTDEVGAERLRIDCGRGLFYRQSVCPSVRRASSGHPLHNGPAALQHATTSVRPFAQVLVCVCAGVFVLLHHFLPDTIDMTALRHSLQFNTRVNKFIGPRFLNFAQHKLKIEPPFHLSYEWVGSV